MKKELRFPVFVGKNEVLLKKTDNIFEFCDDHIKVNVKYLVDKPKNEEGEEAYVREEYLNEYMVTIAKKAICYIGVIWNNKSEQYILDITLNEGGWGYGMEDKAHAMELYNELTEWWLG